MTKREAFKIFKEAKVFSTFCMTLSQISVADYRGFLKGRPLYKGEYKERGFLTAYFMSLEQLQIDDEKGINDLIHHIKYNWIRTSMITIQQ
jgi:hypothetical protein